MKKITKYISLFFCICFILSCHLQPPKSVVVKSKAKYNFSLGEISQDLSEHFSVDEILKQEEESPLKIYEYKPEGENQKTMKMLMEIPVQQISLDVSSYFEETDISEKLEEMSFTQKVSVPEFKNQQISRKIDISTVNDTINSLFLIGGVNSPKIPLNFDSSEERVDSLFLFDSISYKSGILTVESNIDNLGDFFKGEIKGDVILKYNDEEVSRATFINGFAELSLEDVTLYKQGMFIEFSEGLGNIAWKGKIEGEIRSAQGLSIDPVFIDVDEEMEIDFSEASFDNFLIGEGNLKVNIALPENWANIRVNYGAELSGALQADTEVNDEEKVIALNDKELVKEKLFLKSRPQVIIENANIYFEEQPEIQADLQINEIKSVTISIQDDIATDSNYSAELPNDLTDMVKQICFSKSGINISYTNTLPAGNDISILLKSDFLKIDGTKKITSEKAEGTVQIVSEEENIQDINSDKVIDFSTQILLPGCTSPDEKTITVKNVEPGKEYELSINVEPIIEWKYAKVDTSSFSQKNTISTEVDINSFTKMIDDMVGSNISEKIALPNLDTYLFMSKPKNESLDKIEFRGEISAFQGKKVGESFEPIDENSRIYLLNKGSSLKFVDAPVLQKENNVVYTNVENLEASMGPKDLSSILNTTKNSKENTSLCIDYDLSISDENSTSEVLTLYKKDLEGETSASIEILAMIILPLTFNAAEDIEIDLSNLMNSNTDSEDEEEPKDILGRTEAPNSDEENNQIIDLIKSCSLTYQDTQLPIICDNLKLLIDFNPKDNKEPDELELSGGTIEISPEEIFDVYPLVPEIKIKIPKGDSLSIAEQLIVKAKMNVCIETDGEISIWGGNKQ